MFIVENLQVQEISWIEEPGRLQPTGLQKSYMTERLNKKNIRKKKQPPDHTHTPTHTPTTWRQPLSTSQLPHLFLSTAEIILHAQFCNLPFGA